ncbi:hypothetical protein GCM10020254_83170 [Streptomyces goshikiensis]
MGSTLPDAPPVPADARGRYRSPQAGAPSWTLRLRTAGGWATFTRLAPGLTPEAEE